MPDNSDRKLHPIPTKAPVLFCPALFADPKTGRRICAVDHLSICPSTDGRRCLPRPERIR